MGSCAQAAAVGREFIYFTQEILEDSFGEVDEFLGLGLIPVM